MKEVKELFVKEFDVVFNDWIECYSDSEVIEGLNNGKADTVKKINEAESLEKIQEICVDVFTENGCEEDQAFEFYAEVLEKVVV